MPQTKILSLFMSVYRVKTFVNMSQHRNASYICKKLVFEEFGDPLKVLKLKEESLPNIKPNEVLVKILVAPVNPADINCVQGVYPIKPELPGIGGFEAACEVVEVGSGVQDFNIGDRVVPDFDGFGGTWRTYGIIEPKSLIKVPKDIDIVKVAGLSSNPCSAYRMLLDFVKLQPGDAIIQNAANSACGQNVIQFCKHWNIKSVNVIRDRPEVDKLKEYLKSLGADYVVTEEEVRQLNIFKRKECPKPKLALNAVSGRSATEIARQLDIGGILLTYGGMSKEPVTIPVSTFIFKDISCRGFWMSRWTREHKYSDERKQMLNDILELMRNGKLNSPAHKLIPLSEFSEAFGNTVNTAGFVGHKYILDLQ